MNEHSPRFYDFGAFRLDVAKRLLRREGEVVPLMPKAFDVLLALVSHHGHVVEKDELLASVWRDAVVEENTLNVHISALRKSFGEKPSDHRYIVTVPGAGYQFVADVRQVCGEPLEEKPNSGATSPQSQLLELLPREASAAETTAASPLSTPTSNHEACTAALTTSGFNFSDKQTRWNWRRYLSIASAIFVLVVAGFFLIRWRARPAKSAIAQLPFQTTRLTKLTSGKALQVAVSPDGKQVAYVKEEASGQSLWLRQVSIDSEVRLVPPQNLEYLEVAYGREGEFVYYFTRGENGGALYEIPALGGAPRKLLAEVFGSFALAHDGKRVSFFRVTRQRTASLMIANLDGTGEKVVLSFSVESEHLWCLSPPAWSPDDSRVAYLISEEREGHLGKFVALRLSDGGSEDLTPLEWRIGRGAEWTGDGLFVSAQHHDEDQFQLWHINTTDRTERKLTTALQDHYGVSLTKDGRLLATVQRVELANIWLLPLSKSGETKQITSGGSLYYDLAFTPDGKLLYSGRTSGLADIWQMDADGTNRRQLTRDAGSNYRPVASPDGRYLVFHSNRTGEYFLYRTRADGTDPQRLTNENVNEGLADFTPDGQTVVYVNQQGGNPLKRVSVAGGTPVMLNDKWNLTPSVSPDGKLVVTWYDDGQGKGWRLALFSLPAGGEPVKILYVPLTAPVMERVRWSPDGRALLYIDTRDGISNIWRQPLDGGPRSQVTDFKTESIFSFALAPDGKQLAGVRGTLAQDVVLLSELR